jgi:hypothetical protein
MPPDVQKHFKKNIPRFFRKVKIFTIGKISYMSYIQLMTDFVVFITIFSTV